jgi:hypothetical protein
VDRKQLEEALEKLSSQQRAWFAGRCALRALPVLAHRGAEFPYWKKEDVPRYLFALFRVLNVAWGRCFIIPADKTVKLSFIWDFARAADAAAAVSKTDTTAAAAAAAVAVAADDSVVTAAIAATGATNATIVAAAGGATVAAIAADIQWLQKYTDFPPPWPDDLWQGLADTPGLSVWTLLCKALDQGLRAQGLGYWADEFQYWLQGRFDLTRIERCLSLPEEVCKEGVEAMLTWIGTREHFSYASLESTIIAGKENDASQQAARIAELELQANLSEADKQRLKLENTRLAEQLAQQRQRQEAMEQALQAALRKQEEALSGRIDQSVEAISGSLVSADQEIKSHRRWSGRLRRMALALLGLALAAIVWTLFNAPDAATLGKDGSMAFYLLRISPILLLLLMAATLLRHDAKLMQELRELIRQKQQVERLTGLYKASQYARREVEESRQLAEDTFGKITDHLLALQDGKSEDAKPTDKDGDDSMPAILKALTELIAGIKGKSP